MLRKKAFFACLKLKAANEKSDRVKTKTPIMK